MDGGGNASITKFENRLNTTTLIIGVLVFFTAIIMGVLYGSEISLLIGSIGGLLFLLASLYGTIGTTPKSIEIHSNELILYSYFNKKKGITLESLEYVLIHPPDPPQWRKKYLAGGYAKPRNGRIFVFTREIGYAIREAYREKMGCYPPKKPGTIPWN